MPIIRWWHDPEETVWVEDYTAPWTWTEYHQNLNAVRAMILKTPEKPVYLVHRVSGSPTGGGSILSHLRRSFEAVTHNVQLNIMVFNISTPSRNQFSANMFQIALKLFHHDGRTMIVGSLEEAFKRIEQHRQQKQAAAR